MSCPILKEISLKAIDKLRCKLFSSSSSIHTSPIHTSLPLSSSSSGSGSSPQVVEDLCALLSELSVSMGDVPGYQIPSPYVCMGGGSGSGSSTTYIGVSKCASQSTCSTTSSSVCMAASYSSDSYGSVCMASSSTSSTYIPTMSTGSRSSSSPSLSSSSHSSISIPIPIPMQKQPDLAAPSPSASSSLFSTSCPILSASSSSCLPASSLRGPPLPQLESNLRTKRQAAQQGACPMQQLQAMGFCNEIHVCMYVFE